MFILRQITKKGKISNMCIGTMYEVVSKEIDKEGFEFLLRVVNSHPDQKDIYAILIYGEGQNTYPLYKGVRSYIMTESGKTFDNISYRE
jgi:hypothetical protein